MMLISIADQLPDESYLERWPSDDRADAGFRQGTLIQFGLCVISVANNTVAHEPSSCRYRRISTH